MPLFLVRHGETEWNRLGRQQGRADSPLTALGCRQVRACAEILADHASVDVQLVTSPLGRAVASAQIIRERLALPENKVAVENALAEHDWGSWEGLTKPEIELRFPAESSRREADRWGYRVPGGESYRQLSDRVRPWLEGLDLASDTIVVAHDMVSRVRPRRPPWPFASRNAEPRTSADSHLPPGSRWRRGAGRDQRCLTSYGDGDRLTLGTVPGRHRPVRARSVWPTRAIARCDLDF